VRQLGTLDLEYTGVGLIKDSFKVVGEIVTLGGVGRLEDAKAKYQKLYSEYEHLRGECQRVEAQAQECLVAIGKALTYARERVGTAHRVLRQRGAQVGDFDLGRTPLTLQTVQKFETGFSTAARIGSGTVAGTSAGIGAWALVSTFGAASTGTAISTLGGAAATNATLAWFGGGALAAGGAGVAGGTAILGGIVALPLVYFAGRGLHNKAAQLEQEIPKLQSAIEQGRKQLHGASDQLALLREKRGDLTRACYSYAERVDGLVARIQPWGIWSRLKQAALRLFKRPALSDEGMRAVRELDTTTLAFLTRFGGSVDGHHSQAK
jgi:prefoldin subunit 5